jgi:lysophospholipase L1-like esterase
MLEPRSLMTRWEGVCVCRNGSRHLPLLLETHRPIDLVIIFLGVNDLKRRFDATPFDIAQGAAELVGIVNRSIAGTEGRAVDLSAASQSAQRFSQSL